MDEDEIRKSAALEQRHWWYAERRALVRRLVSPLTRALDVGCGGGNTAVLRDLGLGVVRGDARRLPVRNASMDLVMSTDMWEHIDDEAVASETHRVLRPGGRVLVAVPCSMSLWSGHDVALGHVRRYEKAELVLSTARSRVGSGNVTESTCPLLPCLAARRTAQG